MQSIVLEAKVRDIFGKKLAPARKDGQVPAIVYGNKKDNQPVMLNSHDFLKIFSEAGQSTILKLKLDGQEADNVLIHEVSLDPVTSLPRHVDLYRINMNKEIRTEVPLHFVGESLAVFQDEGTLFKNIEEVEVETLPATLPGHIEVDISVLDDFTKTINVEDLTAPEGVAVLNDPEQLICKVEPPRTEEEIAALDEEIGDAIPEGAAEGEEEVTEGEEGEETPAEGGEEEAEAGGEPASEKAAPEAGKDKPKEEKSK